VELAAERIRAARVLMLQLEVPMSTVLSAARIAAEAGVAVILDPAPAAPLDDALLERVTVLTPNETEAEQLTGLSVRDEASARRAAGRLLERGVGQVLITLGAQGAFWADRQQSRLVPAVPVEAVDSTAAGDAFNGGLAAALAEGRPMDQALARANLAGALAATRLGAQPSLPTLAQLDDFARDRGLL